MTTIVINNSEMVKEVPIKLADGSSDSVFIQPKSRAKIPEGSSVDSQFASLNRGSILVRIQGE